MHQGIEDLKEYGERQGRVQDFPSPRRDAASPISMRRVVAEGHTAQSALFIASTLTEGLASSIQQSGQAWSSSVKHSLK